jgi:two-component system, NtrC family, response regulator AtoC
LIVSRDAHVSRFLSSWVEARQGTALVVDSADEAARRFSSDQQELLVVDINSSEGLAALKALRLIDHDTPIVAVAMRGATGRIVDAMKWGATDVMSAPFDSSDVDVVLGRVLTLRQSKDEMAAMRHEVRSQSRHAMLFGAGEAMGLIKNLIECVVDTDVTVLIQGETGTGKELIARAIAAPSIGRGKPFVKINCAALPGELFESELFGFERGAFTGAVQTKAGKFETASGGTLFLDEIGEIPLHMQSKLLQVLQDGHFSKLGGHGETHAASRVIAATNRNLNEAVAAGAFRADLLFRLNVIPMWLPPLRERRADIPSLAEFFLKRWSVYYNRRLAPISREMMDACLRYAWPGNIRELENVIKRLVVLGDEVAVRRDITRSLVAAEVDAPLVEAPTGGSTERHTHSLKAVSRRAARSVERVMIERMLRQTQWNLKETAQNLGISYKALHYKIKENGLLTGDLRSASSLADRPTDTRACATVSSRHDQEPLYAGSMSVSSGSTGD